MKKQRLPATEDFRSSVGRTGGRQCSRGLYVTWPITLLVRLELGTCELLTKALIDKVAQDSPTVGANFRNIR
jgi:hypothetical protein